MTDNKAKFRNIEKLWSLSFIYQLFVYVLLLIYLSKHLCYTIIILLKISSDKQKTFRVEDDIFAINLFKIRDCLLFGVKFA